MKRSGNVKHLALAVVLVLCAATALAAHPPEAAQDWDPQAPILFSPETPASRLLGGCSAVASCQDGSTVYCEGSNYTCASFDASCSSPQGHVECDGVEHWCPAVSALTVSVSCDVSFRRIVCTATATGGMPPYSYSWSYSGSASVWFSNGNKATASWPPSGCTGGNWFSVLVTDSCGATAVDSETAYCP